MRYDLYKRTVTTFKLYIAEFSEKVTWMFRSKETIRIVIAKFLLYFYIRTQVVKGGITRIVTTGGRLRGKERSVVSGSKTLIIIDYTKMKMKIKQTWTSKSFLKIEAKLLQIMRSYPVITAGLTKVLADPVVSILYVLGYYDDGFTLETMDDTALGDLDYRMP